MITLSALRSSSGSAYMSPCRKPAEPIPTASSLARASRSISDERSMPIAAVAWRANNSIIRPVPVPMSTRRPIGRSARAPVDGALDLAFGDVERADDVPHLGMSGEIAGGGFGAVGAHRLQPGRIAGQHPLAVGIEPMIDHVHQRPRAIGIGQRKEHPAAFLAAIDDAGIAQDLDVARDARLALVEHLRELADRQFHRPQQGKDPQPRGIGQSLEQVRQAEASRSRNKDIKKSLYPSIAERRGDENTASRKHGKIMSIA